jgi:hypothetical protein
MHGQAGNGSLAEMLKSTRPATRDCMRLFNPILGPRPMVRGSIREPVPSSYGSTRLPKGTYTSFISNGAIESLGCFEISNPFLSRQIY